MDTGPQRPLLFISAPRPGYRWSRRAPEPGEVYQERERDPFRDMVAFPSQGGMISFETGRQGAELATWGLWVHPASRWSPHARCRHTVFPGPHFSAPHSCPQNPSPGQSLPTYLHPLGLSWVPACFETYLWCFLSLVSPFVPPPGPWLLNSLPFSVPQFSWSLPVLSPGRSPCLCPHLVQDPSSLFGLSLPLVTSQGLCLVTVHGGCWMRTT